MRRWLPVAAVVAILVAPAVGLGVLAIAVDDTPSDLVVEPEPVLTEPTVRLSDGEQQARLVFDLGDPRDVDSAGATGVVTAVHVKPGDTVEPGDAVYSVNGVQRRAMAGAQPLYRDLGAEARGDDVTRVERYLRDRGLLELGPDEFFGWKTAVATREYESRVGVAEPTGVFSAGLVLWLPESPFEVGEVKVEQGAQAPAAGQPILVSPAPVATARLRTRDGGLVTLPGPSVVEVGGGAGRHDHRCGEHTREGYPRGPRRGRAGVRAGRE